MSEPTPGDPAAQPGLLLSARDIRELELVKRTADGAYRSAGRAGVGNTGETEMEMAEAIAFHIEGMREAGEPIPAPTSRGVTVEVAA